MIAGWRTALRLARREARRAKGRSALVVALIMLPVAALAFLAVQYDTFTLNPQERADRRMGTAQALVSWPYAGPVRQLPNLLQPFPTGDAGEQTRASDEGLLALLPPGSRVLRDQAVGLDMHTANGTGTLRARLLSYDDPLARGIYRQLAGRAPAADDEVALTPAAVDRLGTGVGGTVRGTGGRTFRVVGTVEDPGNLEATTMVLRPQAGLTDDADDPVWLVGTPGPMTWAQVKELNTHGLLALSRHVLANPPPAAEQYPIGARISTADELPVGVLTLLGGAAMLEIVLLAGPAFAVGVRRRQRDLVLVAASGADPRQVRRIVLADGVVLGAVAAVSGAVLGVAAAAATRPLIEEFLTHRSGDFRIFPVGLAIIVGLAVVTGVLAVLVPAWTTSRQDVVTVLAGRRGITRSRRRWPILGVALAAAGVAAAIIGASSTDLAIVLIGLIGFEVGLVLCTPALVGLVARLGRLLPVAPRIALRDTSRNRTAAAPAISAVMAAVIGSLAIAVVLTAEGKRLEGEYGGRDGDVAVSSTAEDAGRAPFSAGLTTAIRDALPVREVHEIGSPVCAGQVCLARPLAPEGLDCPYRAEKRDGPTLTEDEQRAARNDPRCAGLGRDHTYFAGRFGSNVGMTAVIEPAAAGAVANVSAEDGAIAAEALRSGAVVVDDPRYVVNGTVTLSVLQPGKGPDARTISARGVALPHRPEAPIVLMTADTARSLGFGVRPDLIFATTSRMPTVAEQDRLQAMLGAEYDVTVARGPRLVNQSLVILAIVAGVIALGAAALATGLAAADGRADLGTLAAVGASPRLRRTLSLSQSGIIAGLGSVLGVLAGLGASAAVLYALNQGFADQWPAPAEFPITVPWLNLVVALLVVPGVAVLGAGLLTRSRLPIERRRG